MAIFDISGFQEAGTREKLPPIGQSTMYVEDSSIITKKVTSSIGAQSQDVWVVSFKDERGDLFYDYFEVYHKSEARRKIHRAKFLALCKALDIDPDDTGDCVNFSQHKGKPVSMHVDFWFPSTGGTKRQVTDYTHGS